MFRKTVMAGLVAAALAPGLSTAQTTAPAPGSAPGASATTPPQAPASPHTVTGNVGLFSQYIFRGLNQTDGEPALQGGLDYGHSSGLYAGTWASNISWLRDAAIPAYIRGGSLEWDFYGGWKYGLPWDLGLDVGTLYYWYPGTPNHPADTRNPKANTWEAYVALSWKWLSVKYSHGLMNKTFAVLDSRNTYYLDFTANVPIGDFYKPLDGLTFTAHYGIQKFKGTDPRTAPVSNDALFSYDDWKLGLSYALPQSFTVGAYYTDTVDANQAGYGLPAGYPRNLGKGTGTVFLQKTF